MLGRFLRLIIAFKGECKILSSNGSISLNFGIFTFLLHWGAMNLKYPVNTGRKLNVHKTFMRRPGRPLSVLYTLNLRRVYLVSAFYQSQFSFSTRVLSSADFIFIG